jgi:hypothetical protein
MSIYLATKMQKNRMDTDEIEPPRSQEAGEGNEPRMNTDEHGYTGIETENETAD